MQVSNPVFYFVMWVLFCAVAALLARMTDWGGAPASKRSGEFYAAVDGLRGILALNVFIHHGLITYFYLQNGTWGPPASNFYAQLGPVSVSMFFFITGFLFWTKLMGSRNVLPGPFLIKRWWRLMPAYLGYLAVVMILVACGSGFKFVEPVRRVALEVFTWVLCGVPAGFPHINGFSMEVAGASVWTLRIEWFFYLVLPLLGWFAVKRRVLGLLVLSGGVIMGIHVLVHSGAVDRSTIVPLRLFAYSLSCFSVGIATAYLRSKKRNWPALRHFASTAIAAMLLLAVILLVPAGQDLKETLLLAPVFVMVVYGNEFHGLLTSLPIRYLGTISYSVYLLHALVLYGLIEILRRAVPFEPSPVAYWGCVGIAGAVVIAASSVSYRYFELPFLGRRHTQNESTPVAPIGDAVLERLI